MPSLGEIPVDAATSPSEESALDNACVVRGGSSGMFRSTEAVSPVLMIWLTLLAMYFVNCIADHLAVQKKILQCT